MYVPLIIVVCIIILIIYWITKTSYFTERLNMTTPVSKISALYATVYPKLSNLSYTYTYQMFEADVKGLNLQSPLIVYNKLLQLHGTKSNPRNVSMDDYVNLFNIHNII